MLVVQTIARRFAVWDAFVSQRVEATDFQHSSHVDNLAHSQDPNTVMWPTGAAAGLYRREIGRTVRGLRGGRSRRGIRGPVPWIG